jgi:hypothetical protein
MIEPRPPWSSECQLRRTVISGRGNSLRVAGFHRAGYWRDEPGLRPQLNAHLQAYAGTMA